MQTTTLDGQVSVRSDEVFAVELRPMETAGYRIVNADLPTGIEQVGETREPGSGFGSPPRILRYFRCSRPGEYRIAFVQKRQWETVERRSTIAVSCKP